MFLPVYMYVYYLYFLPVILPVTEGEVPDGALPHGQGVRSVEAGPGVSDC